MLLCQYSVTHHGTDIFPVVLQCILTRRTKLERILLFRIDKYTPVSALVGVHLQISRVIQASTTSQQKYEDAVQVHSLACNFISSLITDKHLMTKPLTMWQATASSYIFLYNQGVSMYYGSSKCHVRRSWSMHSSTQLENQM